MLAWGMRLRMEYGVDFYAHLRGSDAIATVVLARRIIGPLQRPRERRHGSTPYVDIVPGNGQMASSIPPGTRQWLRQKATCYDAAQTICLSNWHRPGSYGWLGVQRPVPGLGVDVRRPERVYMRCVVAASARFVGRVSLRSNETGRKGSQESEAAAQGHPVSKTCCQTCCQTYYEACHLRVRKRGGPSYEPGDGAGRGVLASGG
ncbi:hypothetical protein GGS23DRAFT_55030 [Durotheca rogersii]|uniref:uncharacterized protein n=1 Tax=Durotheca rogersii TaxID=419775 RepID=UPI00221F404A|nr:uncharacterized protein GGS23DRAFT_55030 [Durotheca rogersii]KAI5863129.1 hypothetical protein GGS23DRAFT_55030 [Durotheca rogersii]